MIVKVSVVYENDRKMYQAAILEEGGVVITSQYVPWIWPSLQRQIIAMKVAYIATGKAHKSKRGANRGIGITVHEVTPLEKDPNRYKDLKDNS